MTHVQNCTLTVDPISAAAKASFGYRSLSITGPCVTLSAIELVTNFPKPLLDLHE